MRTTLTVDEDNAVLLERLRKERNLSFKDVVNEAIRKGLDSMTVPERERTPFRTAVFDPGAPYIATDNVADVLEMLDESNLSARRGT